MVGCVDTRQVRYSVSQGKSCSKTVVACLPCLHTDGQDETAYVTSCG